MLILSRKKNESVVIDGDIRIEVLQIKGNQIRLGITAPSAVKILRGELPVYEDEPRVAQWAHPTGGQLSEVVAEAV